MLGGMMLLCSAVSHQPKQCGQNSQVSVAAAFRMFLTLKDRPLMIDIKSHHTIYSISRHLSNARIILTQALTDFDLPSRMYS